MDLTFPKVSVAMPTFNQSKYVCEAIDSVLCQDYANIELVIGDDGSTDGTPSILSEYKVKYPDRVLLVLSEINNGISSNCNKILEKCDGKYIAFLAGDDVWLPDKISKQVDLMENTPEASLCLAKVAAFDSETKQVLFTSPPEDFECSKQDDIIDFAYQIGSNASAIMVRRTSVPDYGFENSIPHVSDWLFWIEVLRKGKAVYIDEILTKYRRHDKSMSNYRDQIVVEHLMTLALIERKYEELFGSARNNMDKYILNDASRRYSLTTCKESKQEFLRTIIASTQISIFIGMIFQMVKKQIILLLRKINKIKVSSWGAK